MCNMNCLECSYEDCINDSPATQQERKQSIQIDKDCKKITGVDMTRYIHNRPDKEEYEKLRNMEYEHKRNGTPKRKKQKCEYYLRHREERLAYQNNYNAQHKEEVLSRRRAYYEAHKEEINAKRREERRKKRNRGDKNVS